MVFTDAGESFVPKTLSWTLSKTDGSIVNEREDIEVETPASTVTIGLSDLDLVLPAAYDLLRIFTLSGTYDSVLGSDLPIVDEVAFEIDPAINKSPPA
jgi:hypothetical protein